MVRIARAVWQLELVVTMETACHGLGRSDPDLPDDAPVRCFFHISETHRLLVIDADFAGRPDGFCAQLPSC
jgi:hypothetical protein